MAQPGTTQSRVFVAVAMGGLAFALLSLLAVPAGAPGGLVLLGLGLISAAFLAVWLARRASSARSAWRTGCFANSLVSLGVAAGFRVQDELWSGRSPYVEDIDRAIGPLNHLLWALAARAGLVALAVAAVLFAISCWLLRPPHRKA
jgi:hypothetical protein